MTSKLTVVLTLRGETPFGIAASIQRELDRLSSLRQRDEMERQWAGRQFFDAGRAALREVPHE